MMKQALVALVVLLFQKGCDAQVGLTLPNTNLAENSPVGTTVLDMAATTTGATGGTTYGFIGTSNEFSITAAELLVKAGAVLNFEGTPNTYTLTITVEDSAMPVTTATATLTVALTDVNEAPTFAQANGYILCTDQNATAGTVAGTVIATDEDAGASGTLSYTINAGGNTDTTFEVNNGNISVASMKTADDFPYVLELVATDGDGTPLSATTTVVIVYDVCHHSGASRIVGFTVALVSFFFHLIKY